MKGIRITGAAMALIAAFATAGLPMEGQLSPALHSFRLPSARCQDIVGGGILPPEKAGYLRSREFSESMESVAAGSSYYSPAVVPPEWKVAASAWKGGATARFPSTVGAEQAEAGGNRPVPGSPEFDLGEAGCPSLLIYRAFLDYRAKTERSDLSPIYPYQVRMASAELAERFERVAQRARRIEDSILEAERMGARECSPTELSIAWAELETAGHRAAENGYDIGKTEAAFANAERAAANLLVKRRLASSGKFICYAR